MKLFFEYIILVIKNLYFVLSVLVNIIGIFVNFISDFSIPNSYLIIVAILGFISSNYILFKNNAPFTTTYIKEIDKNPIICNNYSDYNTIEVCLYYNLIINNNSNRNEIIKDIKIENKSEESILDLNKSYIGNEKVPGFSKPLASMGIIDLIEFPLLVNTGETHVYIVSLHMKMSADTLAELKEKINTMKNIELNIEIKKDRFKNISKENKKIIINKDKLMNEIKKGNSIEKNWILLKG